MVDRADGVGGVAVVGVGLLYRLLTDIVVTDNDKLLRRLI